MGTTASGLPYPEPTDPVADGAAAIRELAEAIDLAAASRPWGHFKPPTDQSFPASGFSRCIFAKVAGPMTVNVDGDIQATTAGVYVFTANLTFILGPISGTEPYITVQLAHFGSGGGAQTEWLTGGNYWTQVSVAKPLVMAAGDKVQFQCAPSALAGATLSGHRSHVSVHRL